MKKNMLVLLSGLALMAFFSCTHDDLSSRKENSAQLVVSQSTVHTGSPVQLRITNVPAGAVAKWTASPAANVQFDSSYSYQQNSVTITQPGTYTISAEMHYAPCSAAALAHPGMDTCFNS